MQRSDAPSKISIPFAESGDRATVPNASQIGIVDGKASWPDGFPPLTATALAAGGVPPSVQDMNGALYAGTAAARWTGAGAGYPYDSAFSSLVGGYPAGARVLRSDGAGYWLSTVDDNTTDPESSGAAAAGWVPDVTAGVAAVTMTSANVTLAPLQYGRRIIALSGTLTADLQLIMPPIAGQQWTIANGCSGAHTVTTKTAAGAGPAVTAGEVAQVFCDGTAIHRAAPMDHGEQYFSTPGPFTFTPSVTAYHDIEVWSGGAGGIGGANQGAGAGGGYARVRALLVAGAAYAGTVGAGGHGGNSADSGSGGDSNFAALAVAVGATGLTYPSAVPSGPGAGSVGTLLLTGSVGDDIQGSTMEYGLGGESPRGGGRSVAEGSAPGGGGGARASGTGYGGAAGGCLVTW